MVQREIINLVDKADIRSLSALNPFISIAAIVSEWVIISTSIAIYCFFPNPLVYILVWALIGTRMYALYSLLHDGMHYLLFPDRKVNDWLCRLFLAWPLFISLTKIRKAHLAHHQYLKTDQDPEAAHLKYTEFQFPKPASELIFTFTADLTGINFARYFLLRLRRVFIFRKKEDTKAAIGKHTLTTFIKILYYTVVFSMIIYMAWIIPFLIYWLIPYVTVFQVLNRLRLSTEHFHIPEDKAFQTRTVRLNMIEQFIFSPHNLGFHAEHHIYPSVPFYRLGKLHKNLMTNTHYEKNIVVNKSYLDVIKEYVK